MATDMKWQMFASIFLMIVVVCALFQFLGRYVMNYRLGKRYFLITLFYVIPILAIRYNKIAEVKYFPFKKALVPSMVWRFGNRLVGDCALITLRGYAIFKRIIISPNSVEQFIAEIETKIEKAK